MRSTSELKHLNNNIPKFPNRANKWPCSKIRNPLCFKLSRGAWIPTSSFGCSAVGATAQAPTQHETVYFCAVWAACTKGIPSSSMVSQSCLLDAITELDTLLDCHMFSIFRIKSVSHHPPEQSSHRRVVWESTWHKFSDGD